jgi:hypothetical protein
LPNAPEFGRKNCLGPSPLDVPRPDFKLLKLLILRTVYDCLNYTTKKQLPGLIWTAGIVAVNALEFQLETGVVVDLNPTIEKHRSADFLSE